MADRLVQHGHEAGHAHFSQQGGLRQVFFEWGGLRVYCYPVMIYLGMGVAAVVADYAARRAGMVPGRVLITMLILTVPGLIGARLLHVASHWSLYRREPWHIWQAYKGGAAAQGGLLPAMIVSVPLLAAMQLPFGAFWDVATFSILIWLIFGKVGCLLHGCCSGRPSSGPLALYLPDHRGIWRHRMPSQLLEAVWALLLLLGAAGLWTVRPFPGAVFLSTVAAYGIGRFFLQRMRQGQDRIGSLNIQQALSLALIAVSLISFACALSLPATSP